MPRQSIRKGTWRKAAFTPADLHRISAILTFFAVVRAVDYILPPTTSRMEEAGPMWIWPSMLLTGVACLMLGAVQKRHLLIWLGHGVLGMTYAAIASMAFLDSLLALDGFRNAGPLVLVSVIHWLFWWRTGPRPLTVEDRVRQVSPPVIGQEGGS